MKKNRTFHDPLRSVRSNTLNLIGWNTTPVLFHINCQICWLYQRIYFSNVESACSYSDACGWKYTLSTLHSKIFLPSLHHSTRSIVSSWWQVLRLCLSCISSVRLRQSPPAFSKLPLYFSSAYPYFLPPQCPHTVFFLHFSFLPVSSFSWCFLFQNFYHLLLFSFCPAFYFSLFPYLKRWL